MSFPCASFTMLCTELSLAWSTLIRDSLSCLEYSLRAKTLCQISPQTGRLKGEDEPLSALIYNPLGVSVGGVCIFRRHKAGI